MPSHPPLKPHQEEPVLTVPVLEALCDDELREAALEHATPSDLVIAAVIIVKPHNDHQIHDRWVISKRLTPLIRAADGPATIAAILRTAHTREFPWHVATQLFLDSGTPFKNGQYHTLEEVLEWLSHQSYGPTVINECTLWELTRRMARWDLKRDFRHVQAATPYLTDPEVIKTAARSFDPKTASPAMVRASDVLDADELFELLDSVFVTDTAWKHACANLPLEYVRKFAFRTDFSFTRREFACSLLETEELTRELGSGSHPQNVLDSIEKALATHVVAA